MCIPCTLSTIVNSPSSAGTRFRRRELSLSIERKRACIGQDMEGENADANEGSGWLKEGGKLWGRSSRRCSTGKVDTESRGRWKAPQDCIGSCNIVIANNGSHPFPTHRRASCASRPSFVFQALSNILFPILPAPWTRGCNKIHLFRAQKKIPYHASFD